MKGVSKMKNRKIKNAVIYARCTTIDQQFGESINVQIEKCMSFAKKNGYSVPAEPFIDAGISGVTADGPALKELFDYCGNKKNGISAVICYKMDRLTRNIADYIYLVKVLKKQNIEVLFVAEIDSIGKFMKAMEAAIAALYNDDMHKRTKAGLAKRKSKNK